MNLCIWCSLGRTGATETSSFPTTSALRKNKVSSLISLYFHILYLCAIIFSRAEEHSQMSEARAGKLKVHLPPLQETSVFKTSFHIGLQALIIKEYVVLLDVGHVFHLTKRNNRLLQELAQF